MSLTTRSAALLHDPQKRQREYDAKYGRIMDPANRESFVYLIFAENGDCLYVGRSVKPAQRWRAHQLNPRAEWTERATRFRKSGPYTHQVACELEREAIELYQPLHNRMFTLAHGWKPRAS